MKLLQINVSANWGSHGKIAEAIGHLALKKGWDSMIAYGRVYSPSESQLIRIGTDFDINIHGIATRFFDAHGIASKNSTKKFIEKVSLYNPDIIHLHNIHGYYLNYPILFKWLKEWGGPVVWTLHDCWPFTGHCAYYSYQKCYKWQEKCCECPQLKAYPASFWKDRSYKNFLQKKLWFTSLANLHIVTVSDWLKHEVEQSFLGDYDIRTIHNGIDLNVFKPLRNQKRSDKFIILGVANVWEERKGLKDFISLRKILSDKYEIKLVGLSESQISSLPEGIIGIGRTANVNQLVELYSNADIYINASVEETLGMTTIEAMACGTPTIVYDSTACSEPIEKNICKAVPANDIFALKKMIEIIESEKNHQQPKILRAWVETHFDQRNCFKEYIDLYQELKAN